MLRVFHAQLVQLWRAPFLPLAINDGDAVRDEQGPQLSPRLRQTLSLLAGGLSEKQIALRLGISAHTVHDYVKALHRHFGVSCRSELLLRSRAVEETFFRRGVTFAPDFGARIFDSEDCAAAPPAGQPSSCSSASNRARTACAIRSLAL